MLSLLEKATQSAHRRRSTEVSDEQIELAIAWLDNKVSSDQVMEALQTKGKQATHSKMILWLREAYVRGIILKRREPTND